MYVFVFSLFFTGGQQVGNPDFAIVDEAYPYISKLLLTDNSPRLRAALKYMIYGKDDVFDAGESGGAPTGPAVSYILSALSCRPATSCYCLLEAACYCSHPLQHHAHLPDPACRPPDRPACCLYCLMILPADDLLSAFEVLA